LRDLEERVWRVPPRFGEQKATARLAAGLSGFLHHYRKMGGDMIDGKDILALGWPAGKVIGLGLETVRALESRGLSRDEVLAELEDVRQDPGAALERESDGPMAELAREWVRIEAAEAGASEEELRALPLPYHAWGEADVDDAARLQMETALRLPVAAGGALMADAHVGYGLPIGGVLAVREAVIPWAVGLDIACRLRLSVFELSSHMLGQKKNEFKRALEDETFFGAGVRHDGHSSHEVLDDPAWGATSFLRGLKDTARVQIGTSGSGNHFVEFGAFTVPEDLGAEKARVLAPLEPGRSYLALLSHSGSRGVGNKIATRYSKIAEERRSGLEGEAKKLAWLELSSEEGQEYWLSMRLAGRFAAANHAVIHDRLARRIGDEAAFVTEHHHNFAFTEQWRGEEMIVHRKGATPAGTGVLGIVPGTMADTGYLTLGLGVEDSLNSASHGAGRRMSRTRAFKELDGDAWREDLREKGITLLGGALDEAPAAYKDVDGVMAAQADLVEAIGEFSPRIVRMDASSKRNRRSRKSGRRADRYPAEG
jgi:tRNA-splicing ligase RtcB (3'-phosphate/5'-hydroxy nucleic acid ligase)